MTAPQPQTLRGGHITHDPRLGRVPEWDEKNLQYLIRRLTAPNIAPRSYTWPVGRSMGNQIYLDQGQEGACVGFSFAHELAAKPVIVPGITNAQGEIIYHGAQDNDQWAGSDYEGSSVLGGAKYLTAKGFYASYAWTRDVHELAVAVSRKGPCVLGITMHEGMMSPDADGFLRMTGNVVGGHAILCKGYNVRRAAFLLHNSWGRGWGLDGTAWISGADLSALLAQDGEACMPLRKPYHQEVMF